jgi:hypothetical protein
MYLSKENVMTESGNTYGSYNLVSVSPKTYVRWSVIGLVVMGSALGVIFRFSPRAKAFSPMQKKLFVAEKSGRMISLSFSGPAEFISDQCQGVYHVEKRSMVPQEKDRSAPVEVKFSKGRAYSDARCTQPLETLSVPVGEQKTSFYLRDADGVRGLYPIRLEVSALDSPADATQGAHAINHVTKSNKKQMVKRTGKATFKIAKQKKT